MSYLEKADENTVVILPQDSEYMEGASAGLMQYCKEQDLPCFQFFQIIDNGSLMHLKKVIQEYWMKK